MGIHLTMEQTDFIIETVNDAKKTIIQAVEDLRLLGRMGQNVCPVCAHYNHGAGDPKRCPRALKGEDCFEWRGMKEG